MPRNLSPSTTLAVPASVAVANARTIPLFDDLADSGLIRQSALVRSPKHPERPVPAPWSPATHRRRIRDGTWPKPLKISARVSAWLVSECRAVLAAHAAGKSDAEIRELVKQLHALRTVSVNAQGYDHGQIHTRATAQAIQQIHQQLRADFDGKEAA